MTEPERTNEWPRPLRRRCLRCLIKEGKARSLANERDKKKYFPGSKSIWDTVTEEDTAQLMCEMSYFFKLIHKAKDNWSIVVTDAEETAVKACPPVTLRDEKP